MLLTGSSSSKASVLRRLIAEKTVAMPGAFNATVAMMAERTDFEAVYISGAGLVNGIVGYPDVGLLGMDEMAREAGYIANAVKVPCICDADTGFGETWQVMRTVRAYEREGLAGLHLEDQVMPKRCGHLDGKSLIGIEEMQRKIAAACEARQDPDFMIIARCDARAVEGFAESVERGRRYLEAGADAIFAEAMQSRDEFARYADEVGGEPGMIRVFFYLNGFALGDGNLKTSAPLPTSACTAVADPVRVPAQRPGLAPLQDGHRARPRGRRHHEMGGGEGPPGDRRGPGRAEAGVPAPLRRRHVDAVSASRLDRACRLELFE